MKQNILISGVTGFVGVNLKEYLNSDYNIIGVYRSNNVNEINYSEIDLKDFENINVFIHLAGKAHDLKNVSKPEEYFEVNTDLTIKLFDLFLESNCQKFIFISTVKAAIDKIETVLTEEILPEPQTPYGKSKLAAENYLLSKELPKGKQVYILRPCMIHGPGNKGNLNLLYKLISKGIPYPLGKYDNYRSFTSIENFCFIIDKLIDKDLSSGVYNISDDTPISTKKLVELIGEETLKPAKILRLPKFIIEFIANVGNVLRLPFNSHRLDKLTENYQVSNEKIKKELNIDLPVSTEEGLRETIKSF